MLEVDLSGALARLGILADDAAHLMDAEHAGPAILREFGRQQLEWFESRGGGTWPPLAPSTLRQKLRRGFPPDPMVRTGRLRDAVSDPLGRGAGDTMIRMAPGLIEMVVRLPYAHLHPAGTHRHIADDTEETAREMAAVIEQYLEERQG